MKKIQKNHLFACSDGKDERQVAEVAQDMDIVEDELMHNLNISSVEVILHKVLFHSHHLI